jgi:hypothetical protein
MPFYIQDVNGSNLAGPFDTSDAANAAQMEMIANAAGEGVTISGQPVAPPSSDMFLVVEV